MKRKAKIFWHKIRKIKRNKILKYKIRFVLFCTFLLGILVVGIYSFNRSFSAYESHANLSLDIQTAMFVVEPGIMSFNIDLDQIIPSDNSYIYTFSISNFNETMKSDVDLEYNLYLQTTTNLPLSYRLYTEEEYNQNNPGLLTKKERKQDDDNSWYNLMTVETKYQFSYKEKKTYIYYLVIDFPTTYKNVLEYSESLENIKMIIDAQQVV